MQNRILQRPRPPCRHGTHTPVETRRRAGPAASMVSVSVERQAGYSFSMPRLRSRPSASLYVAGPFAMGYTEFYNFLFSATQAFSLKNRRSDRTSVEKARRTGSAVGRRSPGRGLKICFSIHHDCSPARAPPDQRRWRSSISKGGICPEAVLHDNGSAVRRATTEGQAAIRSR
jgi:hypothetical protein